MDPKPAHRSKARRSPSPIGDHEVGYCKPPVATQFKKGQPSANPKGRPRRKEQVPDIAEIAVSNGLHLLTIEEAMRPIQVRNGDKVETVPVFQASARKTFLLAAQGNNPAMRNAILLASQSQAILRKQKEEEIDAAVQYQETTRHRMMLAQRLGTTFEPEIHPDDIDIDHRTGEIAIRGPMNRDEQEAVEWVRGQRDEYAAIINDVCEMILERPDDAYLLRQLSFVVDKLIQVNLSLSPRERTDPHEIIRRCGIDLPEASAGKVQPLLVAPIHGDGVGLEQGLGVDSSAGPAVEDGLDDCG
jgi:hypothetical protein